MKQRQILALLLLRSRTAVSAATLAEELWGERPPRTAASAIHTYVMNLRKAFARVLGMSTAEVAAARLQTRRGGYLLNVAPGELDIHEYEALGNAGDHALQAGDLAGATDAFRHALAVWQGPALMDVEQGRLVRADVARLEQSRLTLTERKIAAELHLGRHRRVLDELASLVVRHRFHEGLHGQFILALHRSEQRARALEVFQQLRKAMASELALEPSPRLQRLQRAVLVGDPTLDANPAAAWLPASP
ncbi:AfsR/SARP family transcriptional regulator [Streptomyces sp. NBC_01803]|uniref:AfsR/SARP family transcriptional regulator n=1 Tax=Streptomyces sp. NBC_01803 TaxID=2975946 RepID=UPI002DDA6950|nr:AfsR/SARP family transcriptional regulator [Streptomyces sp. NBC_01803]WSA47289.1 AfsR/SARP family transcriptional regulator [Streptomyces sp. NBC_01803]